MKRFGWGWEWLETVKATFIATDSCPTNPESELICYGMSVSTTGKDKLRPNSLQAPRQASALIRRAQGLTHNGSPPAPKIGILRSEENRALLSALPIPAGVAWAVLDRMDRQMLRDCVHSFNSSGPDGLLNRHARGTNPRLPTGRKTEPATEKPFQSLERFSLRRMFLSG